MQFHLVRRLLLGAAALSLVALLSAQQSSGSSPQTSDTFRWISFHSPKDQNIVAWVTRSLQVENWTAIREIGVEYDAALVITSDRTNPQAPPSSDTFTIWNVSLTSHVVAPLLKGMNLRWLEWENFAQGQPQELTLLYDNCSNCAASTYFTALYYDLTHHMWTARWVRGGQAALAWDAVPPSNNGIVWTQIYAEMSSGNGLASLCTWNHFDFGKQKPPSDTIFCYDVDPFSGLDRTVEVTGREKVEAMELRLCRGQDTVQGVARGQDSALCQQLLGKEPQRKPATTPPANNLGRSSPPRR